jgi:hypothetical protein
VAQRGPARRSLGNAEIASAARRDVSLGIPVPIVCRWVPATDTGGVSGHLAGRLVQATASSILRRASVTVNLRLRDFAPGLFLPYPTTRECPGISTGGRRPRSRCPTDEELIGRQAEAIIDEVPVRDDAGVEEIRRRLRRHVSHARDGLRRHCSNSSSLATGGTGRPDHVPGIGVMRPAVHSSKRMGTLFSPVPAAMPVLARVRRRGAPPPAGACFA